MEPIKLLDAGFGGLRREVLKYAAHDARVAFTGTIEPLGTVKARMCPVCGRITLHGEPD